MPARINYQHMERMPNTRLRFVQDLPSLNKRRQARFLCDCGRTTDTDLNWVRFGNISSCGCLKSELVAAKNTKHAHATRAAKSGAYRSWQAMHQRVVTQPQYIGIGVCARWSGDAGFIRFLADMGERPDGHTIERVDGTKDYEPTNCIWADRHTQAQNLAHTSKITINGVTHSIAEWCRRTGISYAVVKQRRRTGMTTVQALTTPLNPAKQRKKS